MANDLSISPDRAPAMARNIDRLLGVKDMDHFRRAPLVPANELAAVQSELRRALQPATPAQAIKVAEYLIGCYPNHNIADPEIYTRAMVSLIAEYPIGVATRAADIVTRKSKFVPSRAIVSEECERLLGQLKFAQFIADRTDAERKRRVKEREDLARSEADRLAFLAKHKGKSPLDVLIEKGLTSKGKTENGNEADAGGKDPAPGSGPGGSDQPGQPDGSGEGNGEHPEGDRGGGR